MAEARRTNTVTAAADERSTALLEAHARHATPAKRARGEVIRVWPGTTKPAARALGKANSQARKEPLRYLFWGEQARCVLVCVSLVMPCHIHAHTRARTQREKEETGSPAPGNFLCLPLPPHATQHGEYVCGTSSQSLHSTQHHPPHTTHHTPPAPLYLAHPSLFFSHVRQQVQRKRGSKQRMQPSWEEVEKRRRGGGTQLRR